MAKAGRKSIKGLRLEKHVLGSHLVETGIGAGICMFTVANVGEVEG